MLGRYDDQKKSIIIGLLFVLCELLSAHIHLAIYAALPVKKHYSDCGNTVLPEESLKIVLI